MVINVLLMRLERHVMKERGVVGEQSSVQLVPRQEGYRVSSQLTHEGRQLLLRDDSNSNNDSNDKKCSMELLYTHGDMVHSLPDFAVSLGGNTNVPIEACAYILFIQRGEESITEANTISTTSDSNNKSTSTTICSHIPSTPRIHLAYLPDST